MSSIIKTSLNSETGGVTGGAVEVTVEPVVGSLTVVEVPGGATDEPVDTGPVVSSLTVVEE